MDSFPLRIGLRGLFLALPLACLAQTESRKFFVDSPDKPTEFVMQKCPADRLEVPAKDEFGVQQMAKVLETKKDFWILRTEVSQRMWQAVMVESWEEYLRRATRNKWIRVSPEDFPVYNKPEYPITYMAQEAAWEFCRRLEKLLALKDAGPDLEAILSLGGPHGKFGDHPSVRLPTPLEWEYACRGGSTNSWPYGDKIKFTDANVRWDRGPPLSTWQAYYKSESVPFSGVRLGALQPVGYGAANRWGIVDMLGNASELVDDLEKTRMGMDGDSDVDHVRRCMVNWGMRVLPDYEPDKERLSSYWNRWAGFRFIIEEQAPAGGG